jgi:hypothetical protein
MKDMGMPPMAWFLLGATQPACRPSPIQTLPPFPIRLLSNALRIGLDYCLFGEPRAKAYLEIVGFWTQEYLERKIRKLQQLGRTDMMIAVDENLACSKLQQLEEKIIYFKGSVPLKPVLDFLEKIEDGLPCLSIKVTGGFVRKDQDGQLYYMDRSADVIKYKGYRISCSEIEAILQDHPAVVGACVVGVPDPKVGERIKAMVVLKQDARGVGGTELMRWCRDRLASYKVPSYIEFRDMLPKSKVGKLLRREIISAEQLKIRLI